MKNKLCIFAGTTEGRRLCELLAQSAEVTACVATEYGETTLEPLKGIAVHTGRMDAEEMAAFFLREGFDRVIDATHPYAERVTENIAAAAERAEIPVLRILREKEKRIACAVYVSSVKEAREYLAQREGNILITTGAKELSEYAGLDMARVWARVLPIKSSLEACEKAGVLVSHIIAAQGPFSYESNRALLNDIRAKYLVTKASGKNGGFEEKINAAFDAGAVPVIIGQPPQVSGVTIEEALVRLSDPYVPQQRRITIVGIGTGSHSMMTEEAKAALENCDAVFGARSVLDTLNSQKPCYPEYRSEGVSAVLDEHPSIRQAAVVLRGDTGFFSGAKQLVKAFGNDAVTVIPGISSVSLFAARLGISYDDAACVSLHGRRCNVVRTVDSHQKTFILCGGENSADTVCRRLCEYGLGALDAAVGERLSYPEEKITRGRVEELTSGGFDSLSVLYIENPFAVKRTAVGIPDDAFFRTEVPMTKSEVRAVTLSKLSLNAASVVWDVGAGTGSVSVECALAASEGTVYAVERNADAAALIRENKKRFRTDNLEVIEAEAPGVLCALPVPTHVFIGGCGGRIPETIAAALRKNPTVRIVVNTVTLESAAHVFECMRSFPFAQTEAVQISAARSRKVGRCHMMNALNPVMIFTLQGADRDD